MITFMESKEKMEEAERCLDPQLWHACAGGMVQMPAVNSLVYYFPQGHAEHACGPVDFGRRPVTPYTLCRVSAVKFMADPDSDEVFAKLHLSPLPPDHDAGDGAAVSGESQAEKPASFAKTLTQSDANNGGGFSVPRYCAETIFPRLDYGADPPVQTVLAKDVHGETWKFRHIYRGTPRRHLLTTGWSTFVNHKKLAAGDSIVFLRTDGGDLYVGIRRAKRGAAEGSSGWNCAVVAPYEGKVQAKVRPEAVAAAAAAAAVGRGEFEVVYYPRGSTPEFCVSASLVKAALQIRWCSGLRFKMAFETEDSSRISWFMGTVSSVQVADPLRWPHSPWRLLQVTWDEPDLLQNVKRVSPWLVELVSNMPAIHLSSFSPPRKKLRLPHQHPPFLGTYNNNNNLYGINNTTPAGMQGARHNTQCALSLLSDFRLTNPLPPTSIASENVSCLLTMSNPAPQTPPPRLPPSPPPPRLVLFGKPILTEQQISLTCSANGASSDRERPELGLESGHCKVFVESEGFGRTIDLSLLGSYDDLYSKLAEMFGVENSKARGQALYRDGDGAVKHIGDEPFSDFSKTARRLTILMNSGQYNNIGISENAQKKNIN